MIKNPVLYSRHDDPECYIYYPDDVNFTTVDSESVDQAPVWRRKPVTFDPTLVNEAPPPGTKSAKNIDLDVDPLSMPIFQPLDFLG